MNVEGRAHAQHIRMHAQGAVDARSRASQARPPLATAPWRLDIAAGIFILNFQLIPEDRFDDLDSHIGGPFPCPWIMSITQRPPGMGWTESVRARGGGREPHGSGDGANCRRVVRGDRMGSRPRDIDHGPWAWVLRRLPGPVKLKPDLLGAGSTAILAFATGEVPCRNCPFLS